MKKIMVFVLTVMIMVMSALPAFAATKSNTAGGYSVPSTMTIQVGEKKVFKVTEPGGKYANVSFQYTPTYVSSSDYKAGSYWGKPAEIALTGKAPGSFTAIATVEVHRKAGDPDSSFAKYNLYCKVTVVKKGSTASSSAAKKVALQKISLNKSSLSVNVGGTSKLTVAYTPSNTTASKSVTWTSSNTKVATVSGGKVTGKKAGTATITAKVGSKTATCKLTVKAASSDGSSSGAASGSYKNVTDAYSILNTFRTTKANQWYWNSRNTAKVTTYGLKSLKKDTSLEKTAKTRAKEAWTMYYERGRATHTRPNGSDCFTAYPAGMRTKGENLAWGQTSSRSVILDPSWGWAETNCKYSGQGHRRNMLDSRFTKVGIACYVKDGKTCWAMCLGS